MLKQPLTADLWVAFTSIAKLVPQPMIWIADALNECQQPSSELFAQIATLFLDHKDSRCVVLGRAGSFDSFPGESTVEITPDLTGPDIDAYIQSEVVKSRQLQSAEIRDLASTRCRPKLMGCSSG